jgi:hypothetical protein
VLVVFAEMYRAGGGALDFGAVAGDADPAARAAESARRRSPLERLALWRSRRR